jgi:hypothetical protein
MGARFINAGRVPAAARPGTVAIDSESPCRNQPPPLSRRRFGTYTNTTSANTNAAIGAVELPSRDQYAIARTSRSRREGIAIAEGPEIRCAGVSAKGDSETADP